MLKSVSKKLMTLVCALTLVLGLTVTAMAAGIGTKDVTLRGLRNQVRVDYGTHTGSTSYVVLNSMGGDYNEIYANVYDGTTDAGTNVTGTFYVTEGNSANPANSLPAGNTVSLYAGNNTWTVVSVAANIYYNL